MPYIQRMFVRREVDLIYSARQTIRWLQWLASRLIQSGQTTFLIERMQPSWLQTGEQKPSRLILIMLLAGPLYGLIFALINALIGGLIFVLSGTSNEWLLFGLFFGLGIGLLFGLLDGFSGRFRKIKPIERSSILSRKLKSSFYAILFWGVGVGLLFGLPFGLSDGLLVGLRVGRRVGIPFGLIGGLISITAQGYPKGCRVEKGMVSFSFQDQ